MPRMTKAQIGYLLAEYDATARAFRKLAKQMDEQKAAIKALDLSNGRYGDVEYSTGTPREILDQQAAKDALTRAGLPIPTVMTNPSIVVKPVVK